MAGDNAGSADEVVAAPPGAEGPVQYRPRIAVVIVYLYAGQFLSKQQTAQALTAQAAEALTAM